MSKSPEQIVDNVTHASKINLPQKIEEVADRQRQSLIDLAAALLTAGRSEWEVMDVIERASISFDEKLQMSVNLEGTA